MTDAADIRLLLELEAGGTVVTVNSRLARFLRRSFDLQQQAAGRGAWQAPEVLSLDGWLRRCWNDALDAMALSAGPGAEVQSPAGRGRTSSRRQTRRTVAVPAAATGDLFDAAPEAGPSQPVWTPLPTLLSAHAEQVIWERIIEESRHGHDLLQIGATARSARQAWGLLRQWRRTPGDLKAPLPEDAMAFRDWALQFEEECGRLGWADEASLPDHVARFYREGLLEPPPRLLALGFDQPSPQLEELFAAAGCELMEAPEAAAPRRGLRVMCPDAALELETAARWARGLLENAAGGEGDGPSGRAPLIGVVVPDLAERRSVVERVFAEVLHPASVLPPGGGSPVVPLFNVSLGRPLVCVPVVHAALGVLELVGVGEAHIDALSGILRSPFFLGADDEYTCRATVDAQLRRRGKLQVSLRDVYRAARRAVPGCPMLRKGLAAVRRRQRRMAKGRRVRFSYSAWALEFRETLRELGWPGGRSLDSTEYQAVRRWYGLLEQFEELDGASSGADAEGEGREPELYTRSAALARLRQLAAEAVFQPETPGESPVQVLGLLEASAGLVFDHLWVMGLHDEAWPAPAHPNPFLPLDLQRRLKMPRSSPDWELAFAGRVTERLFAAARNVVVSCPERDGDRDLRPSPLIEHLEMTELGGGLADFRLRNPDFSFSSTPLLREKLFATRAVEVVEEVPYVPMAPGELERMRGGTRIFTDQAACPFRAFARHRLGARGLDPCTAGPAPADRGTMVHRALESLWGRLAGSESLYTMTEAQLAGVAESAARTAVIEAFAEPDCRLALLEQERLQRMLLEWLRLERRREPFTVIQRESRRRVSFGGLTVEAIVDRVDRMADGSLVILDYKTSRPDVRDWFGERPTEPQLPIYCASSLARGADSAWSECEEGKGRVAAVAFAQVRTGEMRFLGIARPGDQSLPSVEDYRERKEVAFYESWEELVAAWNEELHALGRAFTAGMVRIDPKDGANTCSRCDLTPLCRIHELALGVTDEGEAAEGEE